MHCVYCVLCTIFMVHEPAALQRITNSIFFFIQLNRFIQVLPDGKMLDRQFFTSLSWLYLCRLRSVFPFYFRYQIPQSKFHCTSWCLITACKINIHLYFVESSVIFCAHASFRLKLGCVYSISHIHQTDSSSGLYITWNKLSISNAADFDCVTKLRKMKNGHDLINEKVFKNTYSPPLLKY